MLSPTFLFLLQDECRRGARRVKLRKAIRKSTGAGCNRGRGQKPSVLVVVNLHLQQSRLRPHFPKVGEGCSFMPYPGLVTQHNRCRCRHPQHRHRYFLSR